MYTMYVPAHTRTYTQHTHALSAPCSQTRNCPTHHEHVHDEHIMSTSTVPLMMYTMYVPAHTRTYTQHTHALSAPCSQTRNCPTHHEDVHDEHIMSTSTVLLMMYTMYVPAHTRTYTQHTHTHCQHHVRKHAIVQHIMSTSTVPLMMYTMYVPAHTHTHTCTHAHIKIYKRCHRSQKRTKRGIRSPAVYFISPCLCTCAEEGCSANTHTHTYMFVHIHQCRG